MKTEEKGSSLFDKVGECLYRYRPSGGYYARVKVGGKEFRRSLNTTDRAVAKSNLAELKQELGIIDADAAKMTVTGLCDRYLKTIQHQKPKTVEAKTNVISRVKAKWLGGVDQQVRHIKPSEVQAFLSTEGARAGKSLYNQHVQVLRALFALAVTDRVIGRSPAAEIKQVKRDRPIRRTPSFEEFKAIVADVRAQAYNADAGASADFLEFLGLAGLGQAEAASLRWGDIDWAREQITTFRHKTSAGFVVPIYPQLRPLLERLQGDKARQPTEKVLRINDAKKALAGACRRLGLPSYSQRALRRMFITRALEKGIDVKVIAQWQGHRDGGQLILSTYAHLNPHHALKMAQMMADD